MKKTIFFILILAAVFFLGTETAKADCYFSNGNPDLDKTNSILNDLKWNPDIPSGMRVYYIPYFYRSYLFPREITNCNGQLKLTLEIKMPREAGTGFYGWLSTPEGYGFPFGPYAAGSGCTLETWTTTATIPLSTVYDEQTWLNLSLNIDRIPSPPNSCGSDVLDDYVIYVRVIDAQFPPICDNDDLCDPSPNQTTGECNYAKDAATIFETGACFMGKCQNKFLETTYCGVSEWGQRFYCTRSGLGINAEWINRGCDSKTCVNTGGSCSDIVKGVIVTGDDGRPILKSEKRGCRDAKPEDNCTTYKCWCPDSCDAGLWYKLVRDCRDEGVDTQAKMVGYPNDTTSLKKIAFYVDDPSFPGFADDDPHWVVGNKKCVQSGSWYSAWWGRVINPDGTIPAGEAGKATQLFKSSAPWCGVQQEYKARLCNQYPYGEQFRVDSDPEIVELYKKPYSHADCFKVATGEFIPPPPNNEICSPNYQTCGRFPGPVRIGECGLLEMEWEYRLCPPGASACLIRKQWEPMLPQMQCPSNGGDGGDGEKHYECNSSQQCVEVPGEEPDECAVGDYDDPPDGKDDDCQKYCEAERCIEAVGPIPPGVLRCSTDDDCINHPIVTNLSVGVKDYCPDEWPGCAVFTFKWWYDYIGPNKYNQLGYRLQIDDNPDFSPPEEVEVDISVTDLNYPPPTENSREIKAASGSEVPLNYLTFGRDYYWRVMVWDVTNHTSEWENYKDLADTDGNGNTSFYRIPRHSYPHPDFFVPPKGVEPGTLVNFRDVSVCYNNDNIGYLCEDKAPPNTYKWDFNWHGEAWVSGAPDTSNQPGDVSYSYSVTGTYMVWLEVCDELDQCCDCDISGDNKCPEVVVGKAEPGKPEWKEIPPF